MKKKTMKNPLILKRLPKKLLLSVSMKVRPAINPAT